MDISARWSPNKENSFSLSIFEQPMIQTRWLNNVLFAYTIHITRLSVGRLRWTQEKDLRIILRNLGFKLSLRLSASELAFEIYDDGFNYLDESNALARARRCMCVKALVSDILITYLDDVCVCGWCWSGLIRNIRNIFAWSRTTK